MIKFHCTACGKCCSKIQGLIPIQEKEFIEEYGFGKLPLVQITQVKDMTFPLWDFEAKRFKEYEKQVNINAKIEPAKGVFDLKSNRFIVFTYQMNSVACPFQDNKKCMIYGTPRALICHLYPFNKSPFIETGHDDTIFGDCPEVGKIKLELNFQDKNILITQLYESFDKTFLASIQHDYIMEWSNKLIMELIKKQLIKPAINYPYDFLKRRIDNSEKIDLMDFLIEMKYKTKEEINQLINDFENYKHAKDKIN